MCCLLRCKTKAETANLKSSVLFNFLLQNCSESSANSVHNISVIATTEKSPSFFGRHFFTWHDVTHNVILGFLMLEESLPDNSVVTRSECIMRSANNHLAPSTSFSDLVQYFHFLVKTASHSTIALS